QSRFRTGYSRSTALTDLVDDVIREQDAGNATVLVLLDYMKAFDMINHEILVAILKYIGLEQPAYALISSFLSERMQRVTLDGNISDTVTITPRVPQGSILGTLLYSLYTFNFMKSQSYCQYHLYADDSQIYASIKPDLSELITNRLNTDLNSLLKTSEDKP
ncbi:unnamed protein product, partial [Acanthoscelides obtectus]